MPLRCEEIEQERPLAAVARPRVRDVGLVAPGDDGGALDELLRRRPDRRAEGLQRRDQRRIAGREAAAVPRHRAALRERVEDDHVGSVAELQRRSRRLLEPELRVGLVGGDARSRARARARRAARRTTSGAVAHGGVVRIVDPEDREPRPRLVVDRVEVGEESVLLTQRHGERPRVREQRAALVDGIARVGVGDRVPGAVGVHDCEREAEDRLLAAERGDDLGVRVERRPEAPLRPRGDRLSQLGQADRCRIAHPVAQPVDQRLLDLRVGRLARVAGAEVDHLDSARLHAPRGLVQAHERIRRLALEDGRDGHRQTVPVRKLQSDS